VYLSPSERSEAAVLHHSLVLAQQSVAAGERRASSIIQEMTNLISAAASARIDYISVADQATLEELSVLRSGDTALVSLAVRIGSTRLIDNQLINV